VTGRETSATGDLTSRMPERVLILGAGGWFGRTTIGLLGRLYPQWTLLPVTGTPRTALISGLSTQLYGWNPAQVWDFAPTTVLNFAFLTRDRVDDLGIGRFIEENELLTSRFLDVVRSASVRRALTVSSGAAVAPAGAAPDIQENPYGHLKFVEERTARDAAEQTDTLLVIARAWSVSGGLVGRPHAYAFSDLIMQAAAGHVRVHSRHEVWRRYVAVDEFVHVALQRLLQHWSGTIDSGGPLIEIRTLARRVVELVNPEATLDFSSSDGSPADRYHSDGTSWNHACRALAHQSMTLDGQIQATAAELLSQHT
jgi:nucleoside-diphosphate-sugar epimerase